MKPQSLALSGVAALQETAIERHKVREVEKYPATLLWKIFDRNGISSWLVFGVIPIIAILCASMVSVLAVLIMTAIYFLPAHIDMNLAGPVEIFAISISVMVMSFAWSYTPIRLGLTSRPPAQWVEQDIALSRVPPFALERAEKIFNVGLLLPTYVVAELRQGEDLLDPILYVEHDGLRIAIAVWDDKGNEILLDE